MTTVPSPCVNWCEINPNDGYCRGCYRTLIEIASWSELSDLDKLAIWDKLEARKPNS
ncbi:DUF1289 domain-containing protein [Polynucleobacter sinensis]|uniref:DUF1289 domain-containing protein n=1 Tax=Polynucleobacter sinensis TaxID=1743157 RepID=UPI0009EE6DC9